FCLSVDRSLTLGDVADQISGRALGEQRDDSASEVISGCHDLEFSFVDRPGDDRRRLAEQSRLDLGIEVDRGVEVGACGVHRRPDGRVERADLAWHRLAVDGRLDCPAIAVPEYHEELRAQDGDAIFEARYGFGRGDVASHADDEEVPDAL